MTDLNSLKEAILDLPCTVFIKDEFFNLLLEEGEVELPAFGEVKKIGKEVFSAPEEGNSSFTVDFEVEDAVFRVSGTFKEDPSNMYLDDDFGYHWDINTLTALTNKAF